MGNPLPISKLPQMRIIHHPQAGPQDSTLPSIQWFDLKYELEDHVHIQHESIVIVVNNKKVYYEDETLLEDVDLKATDVCLVLV